MILFVDAPLASFLAAAPEGVCGAEIRLDAETWACTAFDGHEPPHAVLTAREEDGRTVYVVRVAWTLESCAECGSPENLTAEEDTEICDACRTALNGAADETEQRPADRLAGLPLADLTNALAESLTAAGALTEWDAETIEHVLYPFKRIVEAAGMPWVGSTGGDSDALRFWVKEARERGIETDVESCDECDELLDDGEGYDGLCGTCADRAEEAGRWS